MKIFEMTTDDGSCSQFLEIQSYVQDNHKIQQKCLQLINQGKKNLFIEFGISVELFEFTSGF